MYIITDKIDVIGIIISSLIAVAIALFIRYKAKPKIETVYEDNRKANFNYLFTEMDRFDNEFRVFCETIKNANIALDRDSDTVTQKLHILLQDTDVKKSLDLTCKKIEKIYDEYVRYYPLYCNYLHETFLSNVKSYYLFTIDYITHIVDNSYNPNLADKQKEYVDKIIQYVKSDKTIDTTNQNMTRFMTKWGYQTRRVRVMINRNSIGYYCLIVGLSVSLISYTFLFETSHYTDICIVDGVLNSINKAKLENCITESVNTDIPLYYLGFAGNALLGISAGLFSNISFKRKNK